MLEIIIKGAQVIDGTGKPPFQADIGIEGDTIVEIGDLTSAEAERTIDASGLVAAPGFIDMHTHSDRTLLINPKAESKIRQGVTTEVIGNCGSSPAPILEEMREEFLASQRARELLSWDWSSFASYLAKFREQGIALNIFPLVGHGVLRVMTMGSEARPATPEELGKMKGLLAQSLDEGACGMSSGLYYPPGCYAETGELVELARVLAEKRGFYFSHIRNEGRSALAALEEAIEIGARSGAPVETAHWKLTGRPNWWKQDLALALIEDAQRHGVNINADMYPYLAGSTGLKAGLPNWVHADGVAEMLKRIADKELRERIRRDVARDGLGAGSRWEDILIAWCPKRPDWEGQPLAELAEAMGKDPLDAMLDMLLETEAEISSIHFTMSEDNLRQALQQPWTMIGSDGSSLAPYGLMGRGKNHPRNYGTFPRILGKYVREEKVLSLEQAVHKMTGLAAQKLRLSDRGTLEKGKRADITLFDPERVTDRATFAEPYQYPEGIEYVLVNGKVVIQRGEHTGALPGEILSM